MVSLSRTLRYGEQPNAIACLVAGFLQNIKIKLNASNKVLNSAEYT
jgi:hypothetical protein